MIDHTDIIKIGYNSSLRHYKEGLKILYSSTLDKKKMEYLIMNYPCQLVDKNSYEIGRSLYKVFNINTLLVVNHEKTDLL